jgi:formylmethanofuran dehydrogenase subunit E
MGSSENTPFLTAASPVADNSIPPYTFEEYVELARQFHSYPAPGLLVGGIMTAEAKRRLPEGVLYDAISETAWCLPDAIQLLTPCTIGNGWLRVLDLGVYALSLFDKQTGDGVRVSLAPDRLEAWPDIHAWLFKTKPKRDQDSDRLRESIRLAGCSLCKVEPVVLPPSFLRRRSKGAIARCPLCGDAYPKRHGAVCRRCQGDGPYVEQPFPSPPSPPTMAAVPVSEGLGAPILHDMTQIVPGKSKGPAFRRGDVLTAGDVCRLQQMGRFNVHLDQDSPEGFVHENDAAEAFAEAMAGPGAKLAGPPKEGKAAILASDKGLLVIRTDLLESFNMIPGVMAAARRNYTVLDKGKAVAATRAIPLYLDQVVFEKAMELLGDGPLFEVRPMRSAKAGLLITGNEVFQGIIEDKFEAVIRSKLLNSGCELLKTIIAPDDSAAIAEAIVRLADMECDLIITTAGLSVDPDDLTRQGMTQAGVTDMLYGMPVLPGAMTLAARYGNIQILGVPACALYYKTTSLDVLLPRLLAGVEIRRKDLARLAAGGLCLECAVCTYPKCSFGS